MNDPNREEKIQVLRAKVRELLARPPSTKRVHIQPEYSEEILQDLEALEEMWSSEYQIEETNISISIRVESGEITTMTRNQLVLAAMSPGRGEYFMPVQVQKMFFLLDQQIPTLIGGPHFAHKAADYGPYDPMVYETINELITQGLAVAERQSGNSYKSYRLSYEGQKQGEHLLESMGEVAREYTQGVCEFVLSCNLRELVSAIYEAYPAMRVNAVFRDTP